MKVDSFLSGTRLDQLAQNAREIEELGYDGMATAETSHDPFLPLMLAAEHTTQTEVGTSIAVAFARNPMNLAYTAYDMNQYAEGRFFLGIGSQVKQHIERRFCMPWSQPAERMREYILALRAIWSSWQTGDKLAFRGDFYQHTLMTPFFVPEEGTYGPPKVILAAVGPRMTEVAGEVADGMFVHGFCTERYLREGVLPRVHAGLERAGRSRADFQVSYPGFVVTGNDEKEMAAAADRVRQQIAFYGSTPAYRGVLDLHGWADLHEQLHQLSVGRDADKWERMGECIDDEVLNTFAVVAEPDRVAGEIATRFADNVDRFTFYTPYDGRPSRWAAVAQELRQATA